MTMSFSMRSLDWNPVVIAVLGMKRHLSHAGITLIVLPGGDDSKGASLMYVAGSGGEVRTSNSHELLSTHASPGLSVTTEVWRLADVLEGAYVEGPERTIDIRLLVTQRAVSLRILCNGEYLVPRWLS